MFIPITNGCQIEIHWMSSSQGGTWQNNLVFTKTGFNDSDMDALMSAVAASWTGAAILGQLATAVTLDYIVATDMRSEGASQRTQQTNIVGTGGTNYATLHSAAVATLRTALRGRSYRGRFYLSGLEENSMGAWGISQTVADNLVTVINAMKSNAFAQGWTLVVASKQHNHQVTSPAVCNAVTTVEVRNLIAGTQRRRAPRA